MFKRRRPRAAEVRRLEAEERMEAARREQQRLLLDDLRNQPSSARHGILLPLVGAEDTVDDVDQLRPGI